MPRFVPIYGKLNGQPHPGVVELVNPEHISSLRCELVGVSPDVDPYVTIKVEGLPLSRNWFGRYISADAASIRWKEFLAEVTDDTDSSVTLFDQP